VVYLRDVTNLDIVNEVYNKYLSSNLPSRISLGLKSLPGQDAHLEIEMNAFAPATSTANVNIIRLNKGGKDSENSENSVPVLGAGVNLGKYNILYLTGSYGVASKTGIVSLDITEQTQKALENIQSILK
jgi:enamine deaminase RidA (YjgF/YER057c/UK114 family)